MPMLFTDRVFRLSAYNS